MDWRDRQDELCEQAAEFEEINEELHRAREGTPPPVPPAPSTLAGETWVKARARLLARRQEADRGLA